MGNITMEVVGELDRESAAAFMRSVGVSAAGIAIMQDKMIFRIVRLRQVPTKAANLIKQTMLSKGADAAISVHAADLSEPFTDVLLFATLYQYRAAVRSLRRQPWGLRALADDLTMLLGLSVREKQEFPAE